MPSKKLRKEIKQRVKDYAAKWRSLIKNIIDGVTCYSNMGLPGGSMQLSGICGTITSFQSLYEIYLSNCPDEESDDEPLTILNENDGSMLTRAESDIISGPSNVSPQQQLSIGKFTVSPSINNSKKDGVSKNKADGL